MIQYDTVIPMIKHKDGAVSVGLMQNLREQNDKEKFERVRIPKRLSAQSKGQDSKAIEQAPVKFPV